ncbi:MAG: hypothetical protein JW720_16270, partial [Sedimentisphaerales bacterium]|nr:hypothetical protein [Sedimentisphaerales bacterium]
MCKKLLFFVTFIFAIVAPLLPAYAGDPGVQMYRWNNFTGATIDDLRALATFPDNPDQQQVLLTWDYQPGADNYGTRVFGYVIPTVSDNYTFHLVSDDDSELWVSTDDDPANASVVASITGWTGPEDWDLNTAGPYYLEAGTKYYVETLQRQGDGGNFIRLAWSSPTMARQILSSANLEALPIPVPRNPSPANGAIKVDRNADLGWTPGDGSTSQTLYFGTTNPPPYVGAVGAAATSYDPGTMPYGTRYYWQIVGSEGSSPVWTFATTGDPALVADPHLIAWWEFDGDYTDSSGYGNDVTPFGSTTGFYSDLEREQVLMLGGTNDYVEAPLGLISSLESTTFATWVNFRNTGGSWQRIFDFGSGTGAYMFLCPRMGTADAIRFAINLGGEQIIDPGVYFPTGWCHVAVTINAATTTGTIYLDGEAIGTNTAMTLTPSDLGVTTQNWIGRSQYVADGYLNASVDDFRIYDYAMTGTQVRDLAIALIASRPVPANGLALPAMTNAGTAPPYMVLDYTPGKNAVSHEAWFSDNINDVITRNGAHSLGSPPWPEADEEAYYVGYDYDPIPAFARTPLVLGETYYWVVDETEADSTVRPGMVWSFTVMPEEAWGPTPEDGDPLVLGPDVTLTWNLGDLDTEGKVVSYDVYLGTDQTDVNDADT